MRVGSCFAATLMLLVLAQPAWAVCVIRGGVTNCVRDGKYPKYPNATMRYDQDTPAAPAPDAKTIVLHPTGPDDNAWVLTPQSGVGATVLGGPTAAAFSCGSAGNC